MEGGGVASLSSCDLPVTVVNTGRHSHNDRITFPSSSCGIRVIREWTEMLQTKGLPKVRCTPKQRRQARPLFKVCGLSYTPESADYSKLFVTEDLDYWVEQGPAEGHALDFLHSLHLYILNKTQTGSTKAGE